jgi:hypothetical protein
LIVPVVPAVILTVSDSRTLADGLTVPRLQETVPLLPTGGVVQVTLPGTLIEKKVVLAGSTELSETLVEAAIPPFVTE